MAETERALTALFEAHETVRRHTAGVERAAAAHDRFADLILGGGGADDITKALVDLLGGWAVVLDDAGVRRSEAGYGPRRRRRPHGPRPPRRRPAAAAAIGCGRLTRHGDRYAVGIAAGHEALGLFVLGGWSSPPTTPTCGRRAGRHGHSAVMLSSGRPPTHSSRCAPTSLRTSSPVEGTAPS